MAKSKPSFLQRLTGVTEEPEESIKTKKELKQNYQEEQESRQTPKIEPPASNNTLASEPVKEENWLSESEGQLTIDVYQTPTDIIVKSTIAGVKPEDLDITIANDMITIKGERKQDETIKGEDYYYQECYWGRFSRSVILPVDVISEKTEAHMKNGILTIKLPKAEQLRTRKIQVKDA